MKNFKILSFLFIVSLFFVSVCSGMFTIKNAYADSITWSATTAGRYDVKWQTVAMSQDGSKMLAGVDGGRLYYSSDSGTTWTEVRPAGYDGYWNSVAMSSDGTKMLVGSYNRLYYSSDSGTSWTDTQTAGDADWYSVAM